MLFSGTGKFYFSSLPTAHKAKILTCFILFLVFDGIEVRVVT